MKLRIGHRIKTLRKQAGLTQAQLAERMNFSRQLVSLWEIDESMPDAETVTQLAELFHVSTDYLLGRTEESKPSGNVHRIPPQDLRAIPVLGTIPAGTPMVAHEEEREYIHLPSYLLPQGELYVLHVRGDSMCGGDDPICAGDLAIIQQDTPIEDKDICAVRVNGDEATLKRVHAHDAYIDLLPDNPAYLPEIHRADDVAILGKLIYTMKRHG